MSFIWIWQRHLTLFVMISYCINWEVLASLEFYWNGLQPYLSHQSQYVRVNNSFSDTLLVLSGVPQGSILGPLFFVLFINDLPLCLQFSLAFIYANDTKCLTHRKDLSEMNCLQKDVDNLFHWSLRYDLFFNKFVHLQFWSKNNAVVTYSIDNKTIVTTDSTKDLGITITQSLT